MNMAGAHPVRLLVILMLINFVNYLDRQIIFPLFPLIGQEFSLTYYQLGWLAAGFSIVHALATLPLGLLADRTSRRKVIGFGVFFWSAATFMSGLAGSFRSLLVTRAAVGLGEAAYTPAATAMITASFRGSVRARVQGIYDLGMFAGGALGIALGGILAESVGWRPAFFIVGIPGLLLALSVFHLPEPPRLEQARALPVRSLLRVPAYVMLLLAGLFITFSGHAYIIWGAAFVHEYKGFGLREAGVTLGAIMLVSGLLGVMAGASLADRLARRFPYGRVLTVCAGFFISAPLIYMALHTENKATLLLLFFCGTFFGTWYHGPVTATIHDVIPARAHATAVGLYCLFVNLLATTLAPTLIGKIADRWGLLTGMEVALAAQVMGAAGFVAVACLIARQHRRETSQHEAVPAASRCAGLADFAHLEPIAGTGQPLLRPES